MMHHLGPISVLQFPCLSDNYGFLVRDEATGQVAAIDTPDAGAIADAAASEGWGIDLILNTHWHPDHAGGNEELAKRFGAKVIAPEAEGAKIAHADARVSGGDHVMLGETRLDVLDVPGHTLGHIAYHCADASAAFVGDTLFSLGCGRMFEGTPEVFWASLQKIRALPEDTTLFCAHEYTAANARFALSVDGDNPALTRRSEEVATLRARGEPTVPTPLSLELSTNPFLRADAPPLRKALGMANRPPHEVFAELRRRKDQF